jgi:predicted N-formylglutamate amidohydrolase
MIAPEAQSTLLTAADAAAFEVLEGTDASPWVFLCDHASRLIPARLGTLGLGEADLARHIAWDIGAAEVTRRLQAALGGFAILAGYSRLVIDLNRPPGVPSSIAVRSEDTDIPGNLDLDPSAADVRRRELFEPYHARIEAELDRRAALGLPTVMVTVHSFTPVYAGFVRPWHAGVLYQRDARLAAVLLELLRAEGDLVVGDNEPYAVDDATDYAVVVHGERRGILHVELEMRQDLIEASDGQQAWAERLARVLPRAVEGLLD